jgi:UDP-4-amino-4,6-dideoxy-N-acetyl-beta-L-altrosamine transaminase
MIPYGKHSIGAEEFEAVSEVLRSPWLTQGPQVPAFENELAGRCGAKFGVAVANGTAALHISCLALGVGPGDCVWTSPNSFVASANCARYCGADIDFIDIDPRTRNICVDRLVEKLTLASQRGTLPKALVVVHFAGFPAPMAAIQLLAQRYGFAVIEDAAHALGSHYAENGLPVGCGAYADLTVMSFHPVKTITSLEGGMVFTQKPELLATLRSAAGHGITRDSAWFEQAEAGGWYYEQQALGFNYRMNDLQAAIGRVQLKKLDDFICARQRLFDRYWNALAATPLTLPAQPVKGQQVGWHLFVIGLPQGLDRRAVYDQLHQAGIAVQVHYIPIYRHPYYRKLGFNAADFPVTEAYYQSALSLPLYPDLSFEQQDYVIATLLGMIL